MFDASDIALRRVNNSDTRLLFNWENNRSHWRVSERSEPLSLLEIENFIEEQQKSAFELDQLRYMIVICSSQRCIGTIDLHEIDWDMDRAQVGILIAEDAFRRKNAAYLALEKLFYLAESQLELKWLYARIHDANIPSQRLFLKAGFEKKSGDSSAQKSEAMYINNHIYKKCLNE